MFYVLHPDLLNILLSSTASLRKFHLKMLHKLRGHLSYLPVKPEATLWYL